MKYDQLVISQALAMLEHKVKEQQARPSICSPEAVKQFLTLQLAPLENECFSAIFLDNQHNVIEFEKLFFGTINAASVHPRVIVQRALAHNAAAVILSHNHPSGIAEPSPSDIDITYTLKKILNIINVRVLDHIIVTGKDCVSLAERGQI